MSCAGNAKSRRPPCPTGPDSGTRRPQFNLVKNRFKMSAKNFSGTVILRLSLPVGLQRLPVTATAEYSLQAATRWDGSACHARYAPNAGGFDLAPPVVEKSEQHRETGREIIVLPDEQLQKRRGVKTEEMDFRRGQPVAPSCARKPLSVIAGSGVRPGPGRVLAWRREYHRSGMPVSRQAVCAGPAYHAADRSDAQEARMARFTSGSRLG
jgi:hypothetical protein